MFDTNFTAEGLGAAILNMALQYKLMYLHYDRMLNRIRPKVIIEVVSYSLPKLIVNDIAKKMNIPTIELQHGTMGKYHIAYNFSEKMDLKRFPIIFFSLASFGGTIPDYQLKIQR